MFKKRFHGKIVLQLGSWKILKTWNDHGTLHIPKIREILSILLQSEYSQSWTLALLKFKEILRSSVNFQLFQKFMKFSRNSRSLPSTVKFLKVIRKFSWTMVDFPEVEWTSQRSDWNLPDSSLISANFSEVRYSF